MEPSLSPPWPSASLEASLSFIFSGLRTICYDSVLTQRLYFPGTSVQSSVCTDVYCKALGAFIGQAQEMFKNSTQVLLDCRNQKLLGRAKALDRRCNMVPDNVKELWAEVPQSGKGKKSKPVHKDCHVSRMLLPGLSHHGPTEPTHPPANRAAALLPELTPLSCQD
ncbi:putative small nuclear ribonucleoprotein Sm D2 [Tupaia chinensis]|uniref:Small nuclear ribonucleoprotein Sm D2 n=1 Tax=Tupaia chinensis TaxID=246437 RepID=L9KHC4_TUPCH|nr:putative small nuclear ribonucleoprotein Sm D2 [Tupaia chinensis]